MKTENQLPFDSFLIVSTKYMLRGLKGRGLKNFPLSGFVVLTFEVRTTWQKSISQLRGCGIIFDSRFLPDHLFIFKCALLSACIHSLIFRADADSDGGERGNGLLLSQLEVLFHRHIPVGSGKIHVQRHVSRQHLQSSSVLRPHRQGYHAPIHCGHLKSSLQ